MARSMPAPLPPLELARVHAAYAQAAIEQARAGGVEPAALGLTEPAPETFGVARYITLLEDAARASGDAAFGLHVGERMRPSTFVTYGHVLLSSPNFGVALAQTQRFESLAHDLGRSELLIEGDTATYRWHSPWLATLPSRHLPESVLAGIVCFANYLACARVPVIDVHFPHPQDQAAAASEYQRLLAAPVQFDAAITQARFPARVLEIAIAQADAQLLPLVERHAAQELRVRAEHRQLAAIVHDVRQCLLSRLAQEPMRLGDVAQALGLPVRSLQRKLAEAGVSYAQLLDGTRRELAAHYLADPALSLTEIAYLLGFQEQSSFTHAHRDWHGCSPQQWRARHAPP